MDYKFLQRPNYVILSETGELQELFCKVCGTAIAGQQDVVKGRRRSRSGDWIEEHIIQFRRYNNYAELKIEFKDGSFHVTNGCKTCLHENLTQLQMRELMHADMDLEGTENAENSKLRAPKRVVAVRTDGGGIA